MNHGLVWVQYLYGCSIGRYIIVTKELFTDKNYGPAVIHSLGLHARTQLYQPFLPRDAVLSTVYAIVVSVCVCVCVCVHHTPVLYQNG